MEIERLQVAQLMTILNRQALMIKVSIVAYLMLFSAVACSAQEQVSTPQKFWTEFRQAVLAKDNQKLVSMTQFPLEVRGVDDSQPAKQYKQEQFETIFRKILEQPVVTMEGEKIIANTTRDIINSTKTITQEHSMTDASFRVDQLVFELKNKQWKLVRAYLEE
jgi:hypothetical protein